jgi:hypothetical protein
VEEKIGAFDSSDVFNSHLEVGLRCLIILSASNKAISLDRLCIYDYLSLNTGDLGGPNSLHAAIPNRGVQLYIRREVIQKGIQLLLAKGLVKIQLRSSGIFYKVSNLARPFLAYMKSTYRKNLEFRVDWIIDKFGSLSDKKMNNYVQENVGYWGSEYIGAKLEN